MSIEDYLTIVTAVITIANVITSMTPSKSDNLILDKILKILNFVSLNIGKNKNADEVKQSVWPSYISPEKLCNINSEIEIPVDIEEYQSSGPLKVGENWVWKKGLGKEIEIPVSSIMIVKESDDV